MAIIKDNRIVLGGPIGQSIREAIAYGVEMAPLGTPSNPVVTVTDQTNDGEDVTTTVMPGNNPTIINTTTVKLSQLRALTANHVYHVRILVTIDGNVLEPYLEVHAQP